MTRDEAFLVFESLKKAQWGAEVDDGYYSASQCPICFGLRPSKLADEYITANNSDMHRGHKPGCSMKLAVQISKQHLIDLDKAQVCCVDAKCCPEMAKPPASLLRRILTLGLSK